MEKLYKLTPLEDSFKCNFNLLINGAPRQLGVLDILKEWISFRIGCYRRELVFDCNKKEQKLHLLLGLGKILIDIDKAIKIVRETEKEEMVVPNLMEGFGIDEIQAEYIAEIKLRNLNREYIINRIKEIESLGKEIADMKSLIGDELKIKKEIIKQLLDIKKKYGKPRRTEIISLEHIDEITEDDFIENYPCKAVMSKEGYFKKITMASWRGNDEQKLKDGDVVLCCYDAENRDEVLFISDKGQVYKSRMSEFETTKASALGEYIPAKLNFDEGEGVLFMYPLKEYSPETNVVFVFENGKAVKVPLSSYETKTNRKKLTNAYSTASPAVAAFIETVPFDIMMLNNIDRALVVSTEQIPLKTTRTSQGVQIFTIKPGQKIVSSKNDPSTLFENPSRYRRQKLPSTGIILSDADSGSAQMKLL